MQLIGKAKIGRLSAKGIDYPQLRLPREYSSIAGEIANIFATEHDGKQAFLVALSVPFTSSVRPGVGSIIASAGDFFRATSRLSSTRYCRTFLA